MNLRARRILYMILLLFCVGSLQVDHAGLLGISASDRRPVVADMQRQPNQLDEKGQKFLLEQYKSAVAEIQERSRQESVLFGFKFTLVGAILALLFSVSVKGRRKDEEGNLFSRVFSTPFAACFCWAAVITSAVLDTRIGFHGNMMITLGTWIRDHVEPTLLSSAPEKLEGVLGWETYLAEVSSLSKTQLYPLLQLNANLLTFLLFSATTMVFFCCGPKALRNREPEEPGRERSDLITRRVCLWGCLISNAVFLLVSIQFSFQRSDTVAISCVVFLCALMLTVLLWKGKLAEGSAG